MAKKIVAWACEFGCARRVVTKRKTIEAHEKTCKLNPRRRACPTCRHNRSGFVEHDTGACEGFTCEKDKLGRKEMQYHCPFWVER